MKNKIFLIFCSAFLLYSCTNNSSHYIGEKYLGVKYLNNPLGEEKLPDNDPLIRFDAFDCLTFVETALADGDKEKLTKIRYKDGNIDFVNRNHFTELDWLNNNKDMLENISDDFGKTKIRTVVIDKKSWFKKNFDINTNFKKETVHLKYLPYSNFDTIKTDEVLVVLFISENPSFRDKIGSDLAVVHVGFLLPNGKLRHASSDKGRVLDVDFDDYVKTRKQNKNNIGITLVKIK